MKKVQETEVYLGLTRARYFASSCCNFAAIRRSSWWNLALFDYDVTWWKFTPKACLDVLQSLSTVAALGSIHGVQIVQTPLFGLSCVYRAGTRFGSSLVLDGNASVPARLCPLSKGRKSFQVYL